MENEKDSRSTRSRLIWTLLGVFVFYLVGVFVRHGYGLRWEINNKSGVALHDVSLGFVGWKYQQEIPLHDLAPGQMKRFFFHPCMKASYSFNFTDPQGARHTEQGELYISGYDNSNLTVTILPSTAVEMNVPTPRLVFWESWFGFL